MQKRHKKRINPNRIPVGKTFDYALCYETVTVAGLYYAWLLLLITLFEQELVSSEVAFDIWNTVNSGERESELRQKRLNHTLDWAEKSFNMRSPYRNVSAAKVKSVGDVKAFERKMLSNSLHASLCVICRDMVDAGIFPTDQIRRILLNVRITRDEINLGYSSYKEIEERLLNGGLRMVKNPTDPFDFKLQLLVPCADE